VSTDEIKEAGLAYIQMVKETGCPKLLNDNRELVGPFKAANDGIEKVWTPQIIRNGVRYFAHLVSHGIYGQLSAQDLHQRIAGALDMRIFSYEEVAKAWLRSCPS
jgi:hypothetical protein